MIVTHLHILVNFQHHAGKSSLRKQTVWPVNTTIRLERLGKADCKSAKTKGLTTSLSRALLHDLITEHRGPVALRVSLEIASLQSAETNIDHPGRGDIALDRTTAPYSKISISLFSILLKM